MLNVKRNPVLIVVDAEWVLFLIGILLLAVFWDKIFQYITQLSDGPVPVTKEQTVEAMLVGFGSSFLLTLILTCGVKKRCSLFCKIWYIINIIFILIHLFAFFVTLSFVVFALPFFGWLNLFGLLVLTVQALSLSYRIFAVYTIIDFTELLLIYPIASKHVKSDNTYRESIL